MRSFEVHLRTCIAVRQARWQCPINRLGFGQMVRSESSTQYSLFAICLETNECLFTHTLLNAKDLDPHYYIGVFDRQQWSHIV